MAFTVTWEQSGIPTQVINVSDSALASLESYRRTLTRFEPTLGQQVPVYATVLEMVVGTFMSALVGPAFSAFPPAEIQTAQDAVIQAQAALVVARSAAVVVTTQP